jgi:hypothetical protein
MAEGCVNSIERARIARELSCTQVLQVKDIVLKKFTT